MKKRNENGFTLTELLVVIVILGIITLLAFPQISNLIDSNNKAKYETYENTLKTSAKLYTDSYKEDMFGNNTSGCYDISFESLVNKKLVQDIKINDVTCAGGSYKKTFVRVRKSGEYYKYKVSMLCTNKDNASIIEYSNVIEGDVNSDASFCNGTRLDMDGPTISLSGVSGSGIKSVTLTIKDDYGLLENVKIRYALTLSPSNVPSDSWVNKSFNNKRNVEQVSMSIVLPQVGAGNYYLVVEPISVRDANGNYQTQIFKSNSLQSNSSGCISVGYKMFGINSCADFAEQYMGGSSNWTNRKLQLCDAAGKNCVTATETTCNQVGIKGGKYTLFKYCPSSGNNKGSLK